MIDDIKPPRGAIRSHPRTSPVQRQIIVRPRGRIISDVHPPVPHKAPVWLPEAPKNEVRQLQRPPSSLLKAAPPAKLKKQPKGKRFGFGRMVSASVAGLILVGTGYLGVDTWLTNQQVKRVTESSIAMATPTQEAEGKDESTLPANSIENYKVAPDMPRVLSIPKANVKARILPMSVNKDGSMQAPQNVADSGWYNASAKPGTPGAAVIDGHASGPTREGLFAYLDKLASGDTITIERGDGSQLMYKVLKKEIVPLAEVDMNKLMLPGGKKAEALNLITCTGQWVTGKNTYDHRVIVYTERA